MGTSWTAAEFRARLTYLGLNVKQLAEIQGWDLRTLRREVGGTVPVAERTVRTVSDLIHEADAAVAEMTRRAEAGEPVVIPRWSSDGGGMPGSWWHALVGRLLVECGGAVVVYEDDPIAAP